MRVVKSGLLAISMAALAACTTAPAPAPRAPASVVPAAPLGQPDLLLVISVDQLSSELFEAYAPHFTDGMARVAGGTAFLNGYQAQAATETCPGHSTILTGSLPARTGIVANDWYDLDAPRDEKEVYCAEDETLSDGDPYTVSASHLMVPTLGELMKAANPASRNVAVAGKDRAAVMMGGHNPDQRWYWGGDGFVSDNANALRPKTVDMVSQSTRALIARGIGPLELPDYCASWDKSYRITDTISVGTGRLAVAAGDASGFRRNPAYDGAVLALAGALVTEMRLGKGDAPDILAIGLSATDYVGHAYGNRGAEMCLQMAGLDRNLGDFLRLLDRMGIDYAVALTADHGGMDVPPRVREAGENAAYVDLPEDFLARLADVKARFGVEQPIVYGGPSGDKYLDPDTYAAHGDAFRAAMIDLYRTHPQVAEVFTREQIEAQPIPKGNPARWSMIERVRASYHPARSGDFYVVLKDHIMPIVDPMGTYTATHGTPHEYDRRVPILFWRKGMTPIARPDSAGTTDIMPTLAAMVGVGIDSSTIDGNCLDGVSGATCPGN